MALSQNKERREKQLANLIPCKPGETRNPGGRPKRKPFLEAIIKHMEEHPEDVPAAIKSAFQQSKRGSIAHLRELADRTDGPVKQQIEHTGEDGGPVEHTIRFGDAAKKKLDER